MSGYLLRQDQARADAAAKLCECGHPVGDHRERGYKWVVRVDGTVKELRRRGHRPGLFYCHADGCDCCMEVRLAR